MALLKALWKRRKNDMKGRKIFQWKIKFSETDQIRSVNGHEEVCHPLNHRRQPRGFTQVCSLDGAEISQFRDFLSEFLLY